MILHGNSLEVLKTLDDNSVDSVVCDPPYFLTNSGGSGFMGKEWDSLSVRNAFAESVLRSLSPVWLMGEESSALANVSTKTKSKNQGKSIRALYVTRDSIGQSHKLNQTSFFVLENVLTKPEVLALSRELCPSLISVVESQPENVVYVASNSFTAKCPKSIAQELALNLDTERLCEDLETLHTLMGDQKTSDPIEEKTGKPFERKSTEEISSLVESVESIVLAERYNVTTSSLIEFQKTIRWITSLRFVRNAMGTFTENPANIQLLSERFHYKWLKEVYRVMKPGAHLLAFAGTRTYGRLAVAVEDAGFEIRDQIMWLYGSGFPKSHDVSKAIDKAAGVERESRLDPKLENQTKSIWGAESNRTITAPATDAAKQWQGWGSALKPAVEPVVLARKPLEKGLTIAENVLKYGTGALNIDGSRIGSNPGYSYKNGPGGNTFSVAKGVDGSRTEPVESTQGRWPANVILDEEAAKVLDEQSGVLPKSGGNNGVRNSDQFLGAIKNNGQNLSGRSKGDSGGASRFFYVAKASKRERNAGLDQFDCAKVELDPCVENTELVASLLKDIFALIPNSSTGEFGDHILGMSPKECTSIIRTAIQQTIESRIWNSSTHSHTRGFTRAANSNQMGGTSRAQSVKSLSELTTKIGILLDKAGLATGDAENAILRKLLKLSEQSAWQQRSNFHPTIKPIRLMSYLCKLITPPGGIVLDPFAGSGSTGVAAIKEGFQFIGIELNEEYVEIAKRRINHVKESKDAS